MIDEISTFLAPLTASFALIGMAEMGDKSQLVCMALAVRYRAMPVLLGSISAFILLNLLAVTFGVVLANWVSPRILTLMVAALFLAFGIHALRTAQADDEARPQPQPSRNSLFLATFLMITLAEFGDKTQIAVVGLATSFNPTAVWMGSTLALAATSALGVWAGRTLLQRIPIALAHRISGVLFLLLAIVALLNY